MLSIEQRSVSSASGWRCYLGLGIAGTDRGIPDRVVVGIGNWKELGHALATRGSRISDVMFVDAHNLEEFPRLLGRV